MAGDRLLIGRLPEARLRYRLAALEDTVAEALRRHQPSTAASRLLGEMMVAAALAAANVKGEETLTLRYRGRTCGAVADCTAEGDLRARAQPNDLSEVAFGLYVGDLLTVKWRRGVELYRGLIPVAAPTAGEMLEAYFGESEQWPARARIDVRIAPGGQVARARGAFVTREPGGEPPEDGEDWLAAVGGRLAEPASADTLWAAMDEGDPHAVMSEWARGPAVTVARQDLRFACGCTRAQVALVLLSLGATDLRAWVREEEDPHVVCEYCRERYRFDAHDVEEILRGVQGSLGPDHGAGA